MFLTLINRETLLSSLPKGGVGLEIGVREGDFSATLLANTEPQRLHLVDPWLHEGPTHGTNSQAGSDRLADSVAARFAKEVAAEQVVITRASSHDAVADFPDNYFDWIYIDGNHTYDFVRKDLELFHRTVKDTGFIMGHDYTNNPEYAHYEFGVVEAVNDFVAKYACPFLALTFDGAPTFVLSKAQDGEHISKFTRSIVGHYTVIEIRDFPQRNPFLHKRIDFSNDIVKGLFSF